MGDRCVYTDFWACWGTSPKTMELAGAIFFPVLQHEHRLLEEELHAHLQPDLLVVHHAHEFSWRLAHSKPAVLSLGLRENFLKAEWALSQKVHSCHWLLWTFALPQLAVHSQPPLCVSSSPALLRHSYYVHSCNCSVPCCSTGQNHHTLPAAHRQPPMHAVRRFVPLVAGVQPPATWALKEIWNRISGPVQILLTLQPCSQVLQRAYPSQSWPVWVLLISQKQAESVQMTAWKGKVTQ